MTKQNIVEMTDRAANSAVKPFVNERRAHTTEELKWLAITEALGLPDFSAEEMLANVENKLDITKLISLLSAPLNEEEKNILEARYVEGLTQEAAAVKLGLNRSTLRSKEESLLHRLRLGPSKVRQREKGTR